MAEERMSWQFHFTGQPSFGQFLKTQKKVNCKTTIVATKILLDDAQMGFQKGNFVCSPFSLEIIMGMLTARAQGHTLKQLLDFLGHETLHQLLHDSPSSKLLDQILSTPQIDQGALDICFAHGIWIAKRLNRVQACYQEILTSVYKTNARFVGLCKRGSWSAPFSAERKKNKSFHLMNGETVLVPFMTSMRSYNHGYFRNSQVIQIPCEGKGQSNIFSMYIFLPNKKDGLQDLLQVFHSDHSLFHGDFGLYQVSFDELWIPKFKMSCKLEAHDVMKEMGLTLPFYPFNKQLTRIIDSASPEEDLLYVSKIIQKSFIEIDERGPEAAAANLMRVTLWFMCSIWRFCSKTKFCGKPSVHVHDKRRHLSNCFLHGCSAQSP